MEVTGIRERRKSTPGGVVTSSETRETIAEKARVDGLGDVGPPHAQQSSFIGVLATFVAVGVLCGTIRLRNDNLAGGAKLASKGSPAFLYSGKVAMRHVRTIAAKPHFTGSLELDRTLEYVKGQIDAMRGPAERNGMLLEVEAFTASGTYAYSDPGTHSTYISYSDVPSVVARLSPIAAAGGSVDTAGGALLINNHIDSAVGTPGGSDNVAGVAVALESLRSLTRMTADMDRLSRPVVFLFNGGEEPLLVGADGFVKTHRWASEVAAHINLESSGADDSYMLAQVGRTGPWLEHVFARAVKRPSGIVAASELYESNLVPGESDFRIFREAGIPGYNFVLTRRGEVYHTRYDDAQHVTMKTVLYGGRVLVIPLALELAGRSDAIGKHLAAEDRSRDARAAYFDVLGFFTVVYSASMSAVFASTILVIAAVLFCCYVPDGVCSSSQRLSFLGHSPVGRRRLRMLAVYALCCFAGLASASVAALMYVFVLQRPLSWYGSTRFALAVFVPPFVTGVTTMLQLSLPHGLAAVDTYDSMLHAVSAFYLCILALMLGKGLLMSYLPAAILCGCVLGIVAPFPQSWVFVRFLINTIPGSVFMGPVAYELLCGYLAVLGRTGSAPSDVIASILVGSAAVVTAMGPLLPLYVFYPLTIARVRKWSVWIAILVATLVALLPELTLPHRDAVYSKDAPKRIVVAHFYAPQQSVSNVLGIAPVDVIPVDINTTVRMLPFSELDTLEHVPDWGLLGSSITEAMRDLRPVLDKWSYFEVKEPLQLDVPTASVVSEKDDGSGDRVVSILILAPDAMQISLRIMPVRSGGVVKRWSFADSMNEFRDGEGAYVRHIGGVKGAERLEFSVVVEVDPVTKERPRVEFDVTSSRPGKSRSDVLKVLYFPQWTSPVYLQMTGGGFSL